MEKTKGRLILVLGGSRSGKSQFAEQLAQRLGERLAYLATAPILDEEMSRRVAKHRQRRPERWQTIEEPLQVVEVLESLSKEVDVILLDCLTLWLSNLLLHDNLPEGKNSQSAKEDFILSRVERLGRVMVGSGAHLVVVSNEVGLGLVPDNPLGRLFRDIAGQANQIIARQADEVDWVAAGLPLEIKSRAYQF